ncbi:MAG: DnaJ domain-containing protein [Polaromonas sp.]|nr:DnaJ domain-containing protein [Polaromonas sp.]
MQFKDYYQTMGVDKGATPEDIKRAHRKLARKYHPDVSREKDAEARFKELAEAYDVLKDPEKRATYDQAAANQRADQEFQAPQGGSARGGAGFEGFQGFERDEQGDAGNHSEFFESLFRGMGRQPGSGQHSAVDRHGQDQHASIQTTLEDAYLGATRTVELRVPARDADGRPHVQTRTLEFVIPKGIRAGQHIRLAGQGLAGTGLGHAGDLYLDVQVEPHPLYRVDAASPADVYMDLPVTPWEAALGAEVEAPTPTGRVEVKVPAGSAAGRKLRLKGRGLPATSAGKLPGDFYFTLRIVQPLADDDASRLAYTQMASAFPGFQPRMSLNHQSGFTTTHTASTPKGSP